MKPQRIASQSYRIYGLNGAQEVLSSGHNSINHIDIKSRSVAEKHQVISRLLKNHKSKVNIIDSKKFGIKYNDFRTQGIVVSFEGQIKKQLPQFNEDKDIGLLLCDQITDPQNLGQIIRTAECSGIDGLIIPDRGKAQITNSV